MSQTAPKKKAILVAGMHRSGTSAFTRVINLLGADLPAKLMPPSPENPRGYWEPMEIVLLHEALLTSAGSTWDDITTERVTLTAGESREFRAPLLNILRRDLADSPLFVLKDPRLYRLMPLWLATLKDFGAEPCFVIPVRNPLEVAQSLKLRDGLIPARAYLMWLQQLLSVEFHSRGQRRCFASYEALLADWRSVMRGIGSQLGIEWPRAEEAAAGEIAEFLSAEHRHHHSSTDRLAADAACPEWIKTAYAEALAACEGHEIRAEVFDSISHDLRNAGLIYDPLLAKEGAARRASESESTSARRNAGQEAKIARLTAEVSLLSQETSELAAALGARDEEIEARDTTLRTQAEEIGRLSREAKAQADALRAITESWLWRALYPVRTIVDSLWGLKRTFRRRAITFALSELTHVQRLNDNAWQTTGDDPAFFLISPDERYPTRGWIRLRFELECDGALPVRPCLYLDCGSGFNPTDRRMLPLPEAKVINFVIHLSEDLRGLRFDPSEEPLRFRTGSFRIVEIGKVEAALRILATVVPRMLFTFGSDVRVLHRRWRREGLLGIKQGLMTLYHRVRPRSEGDYGAWVDQNDTLNDEDRNAIRARIDQLGAKPLISVIMPVYNAPAPFLRAAIESVCSQLYPYWELCIADDASTHPQVRKILAEWQKKDSRIKVCFRPANGHISAASNSALALATGEYIALLDQDDVLAPHALYMVAEEFAAHPDADLVYSDEDKLDPAGRRCAPHFKPDWNPDLFYSQNYLSHLGVYRTSLVRAVGGFREGYEGSQDYDLALRCIKRTEPKRIRHLPAILYHWRMSAGSTAADRKGKSYATHAGLQALRDHFSGQAGVEVTEGPYPTTYRVHYPLPNPVPKVSIIIPTRDGHGILRQCIDSVRSKTRYDHYEIIVVDNQSSDPATLDYLASLQSAGLARVLAYDQPFNYSAINNFAVEKADGEVIALLNNDVEVITPGWLSEMVSHAVREGVGAVGAKLYYGDGRIQHAGVVVGLGGVAGHSHKYFQHDAPGYFYRLKLTQGMSAVTAACLVIRKAVFKEAAGLDETDLKIAFNDVDFCLRLRELGYRNVWTPYAELYHHESVSRGQDDTPAKKSRFESELRYMKQRWGERLLHDPCYSPFLTLDLEDFSIADNPRVAPPWRRRAGESLPG